MTTYTDETPMPFGKYLGVKLKDIPASYLVWIYENCEELNFNLKQYLKVNLHILELEVIAEKQKRRLESR